MVDRVGWGTGPPGLRGFKPLAKALPGASGDAGALAAVGGVEWIVPLDAMEPNRKQQGQPSGLALRSEVAALRCILE